MGEARARASRARQRSPGPASAGREPAVQRRRRSVRRPSPRLSCCSRSSRSSRACRSGDLFSALGSGQAVDALKITVETNLIALGIILLVGTPTAWLIATRSGRLRDLAVTLVELPLVLPPAVAGIGLLAAFGRLGLIGGHVGVDREQPRVHEGGGRARRHLRRQPVLHPLGDLGVRGGRPHAHAGCADARRGQARAFLRVALPLAAGGLGSGAALAFARGIGEFGATIMFAGSLRGVTQTLPLAIYEAFDVDFRLALAISAELVAVSAAILLATKLALPMALQLDLTILFAPSSSSVDARGRARDARARRAVRGGQDDRAARGCRAACGRAQGRVVLDGETLYETRTRRPRPRTAAASGSSSRTTRSSRTSRSRRTSASAGAARAAELLDRFRHRRTLRRRGPPELSGGERQRVALARALARDPAVLLLDEPMAALDAHTRADVRAELQELLRDLGLPAILVTHDFEDAAALADRVGVISEGKDAPGRGARRARRGSGRRLRRELHRREPPARLRPRRPARGSPRSCSTAARSSSRPTRPRAASAWSSTRGRSRSRTRRRPTRR